MLLLLLHEHPVLLYVALIHQLSYFYLLGPVQLVQLGELVYPSQLLHSERSDSENQLSLTL